MPQCCISNPEQSACIHLLTVMPVQNLQPNATENQAACTTGKRFSKASDSKQRKAEMTGSKRRKRCVCLPVSGSAHNSACKMGSTRPGGVSSTRPQSTRLLFSARGPQSVVPSKVCTLEKSRTHCISRLTVAPAHTAPLHAASQLLHAARHTPCISCTQPRHMCAATPMHSAKLTHKIAVSQQP